MDKARIGLTPNPDVMCNKLIKFGCFEEVAGKDFDYTATGHYATTTTIDGKVWLSTSPDPVKDQTDFLCQIDSLQVSKLMFPIGHLWKHQVREIAESARLLNAERKDSQGICFLGNIDFRDYIKAHLGENPGDVREIETGHKIGEHKGLWFYTIGQRKGLGFGGGPWFVVKKNIRKNIIFVANGWDTQLQYGHDFRLADFHFITENPFQTRPTPCPSLAGRGEDSSCHEESNYSSPYKGEVGRGAEGLGCSFPIQFKVRHVDHFMPGTLTRDDEGYHIHSPQPIQGIAPGQFGCIYDADARICYGSGEISIYRER
jgi:tRNA-specific 2-thiouridylase